MAQIGVTHPIIINGRGYLMRPGSYTRYRATDFAPRLSTGTLTHSDLDGWNVWSKIDWSGGVGQEKYESGAANRFGEGSDIEARIAGRVTLGGRWVASDASFIANKFIDFSGKVYALGNSSVRAFDPVALTWANSKTGLAAAAVDAAILGALMMVGLGNSQDAYKFDGTTWTALTGIKANSLCAWKGTLWRAWDNNIAGTTDLSASPPTWSTTVAVGDASSKITNLQVVGGYLVICKEDGIWYTGDGSTVVEFVTQRDQVYSGNGRYARSWGGVLWYQEQGRVKSLVLADGGGSRDRTPQIWGSLTRELWNYGIPGHFTSSPRWLFVAFNSAENNYPAVLASDGASWFPCWKGASGETVYGIYYSRLASKLFVNNGATHYQAYNSLAQTVAQDFAASGEMITEWFDAGFEEINKAFKELIVKGIFTTTEIITVYYEIDDSGSWVSFGTVNANETTLPLSITSAAIVAKKIRFKFAFARDAADTSKTPKLTSATLKYLMRPETVYAHRAVLMLGDGQVDMTGATMDDYSTQIESLVSAEDSSTPIEMGSPDGLTHKIYITNSRLQAIRQKEGTLAGQTTLEVDLDITMLNVLPTAQWKQHTEPGFTIRDAYVGTLTTNNPLWDTSQWDLFAWG